MSFWAQLILGLVPGILNAILADLKVNPATFNPTLAAVLQTIDAALDELLGDPVTVAAVAKLKQPKA